MLNVGLPGVVPLHEYHDREPCSRKADMILKQLTDPQAQGMLWASEISKPDLPPTRPHILSLPR